MEAIDSKPRTASRLGEPVWEIAEFFPEQGGWTEKQYLALDTNRLVEFDNGVIEVLSMPTKVHQLIVLFLYKLLDVFVSESKVGGIVLVAPYRIRVPSAKYREPDILYLSSEQDTKSSDVFSSAADLVMEVVSSNDPDRDYVKKRADYAEIGVPEYWIVDPAQQTILVLQLHEGKYIDTGRYGMGQTAVSKRFAGFAVDVSRVFSRMV